MELFGYSTAKTTWWCLSNSIYLSIYPFIHLIIYPSIHLIIYPSIRLYIYIYINPSVSLSIYLSRYHANPGSNNLLSFQKFWWQELSRFIFNQYSPVLVLSLELKLPYDPVLPSVVGWFVVWRVDGRSIMISLKAGMFHLIFIL